MGAERKTHYISPEDKKCTAYHEVRELLNCIYLTLIVISGRTRARGLVH